MTIFNYSNNYSVYIILFISFFLIGFLLAMATRNLNKEKKKKGFKGGRLYGKAKEIDEQLTEEYKDAADLHTSFLQDTMEHHASQKFK